MSQPSPDNAAVVRDWHEARGQQHAVVLRWYRTVGYARCAGVSVDMYEPPAIDGIDIEYLPGIAARIDGRDMTADERDAAHRMLVQMAQDARDALAGLSTLAVHLGGPR